MLFKNNKENAEKVRIAEGEGKRKGYKWVTVKPGDEVELPKDYGINMGFTKVEGDEVEEPAADDEESEDGDGEDEGTDEVSFEDELRAIDGIGKATVADIMKVYPDKASLKIAVINDVEMPFRDDVVEKLKAMFDEAPEGEEEKKEE